MTARTPQRTNFPHRSDPVAHVDVATSLAQDRGEIRALTGMRLFAAAWVVVFHFEFTHGELLARVLAPGFAVVTTGAMGVDLFFVLSGFVIAYTYLDKLGPALRARTAGLFYWARVCRIWPVYALVTTGFLGFLLFKRWYWTVDSPAYQSVQPSLDPLSWLRQMTLTQMWSRPWHDGASFVGPAWSVSAEMCAYALFPLTALLFYRLRRAPRWVLGGAAVLVMAPESMLLLVTGSPYFAFSWLVRILGGFTAGVLVYLVVRDIRRTPRVRRIAGLISWAMVGLTVAGLLIGNWLGPVPPLNSTERGGVVLMLFPPLIGALALGSGWLDRLLSSPFAVHGGRISYSLYLVHVPVFEVFWTAQERVGFLQNESLASVVLTPLVFVFVFVCADLLYRWVEEPARRALRPRRRPTQEPTSSS